MIDLVSQNVSQSLQSITKYQNETKDEIENLEENGPESHFSIFKSQEDLAASPKGV